ncbi:MAG: hypothetical protein HY814_11395 [Candidatus Riflebacteria bacterium]|nr:hypothetical protein [Candidatus Riflebacteria bacterium]
MAKLEMTPNLALMTDEELVKTSRLTRARWLVLYAGVLGSVVGFLALVGFAGWASWTRLLDFQHGFWVALGGIALSGAVMVGTTVFGLFAAVTAMSATVTHGCSFQKPYEKELTRRWGQADLDSYVKEAEAQMADGGPNWIVLSQTHVPGESERVWVRVELSAGHSLVRSCLGPRVQDVVMGHTSELARSHVRSLE